MTETDIEAAAQISIASFDDYNIMMKKMGIGYLRNLYFPKLIAAGPDAGAFAAFRDGKMLGYYCFMTDFFRFNRFALNKELFLNCFYTGLAMLRFRVTFKDIYNIFKTIGWVQPQVRPLDAQVGPIAVAPEIKGTSLGGLVSMTLVRTTLKELKKRGVERCWSTADSRNPSMILTRHLGFHEVSSVRLWGIEEILVMKELAQRNKNKE